MYPARQQGPPRAGFFVRSDFFRRGRPMVRIGAGGAVEEECTLEQLIAWLEEELKNKRDLIELIEDGKAHFFIQELGKPQVDTTVRDLTCAKMKETQIEKHLTSLRPK
jgi:hypothetical protein